MHVTLIPPYLCYCMIKHSIGVLIISVMSNNVGLGTIGNAHGSGLGLDVIAHEMSHFINPRGPTCNLEKYINAFLHAVIVKNLWWVSSRDINKLMSSGWTRDISDSTPSRHWEENDLVLVLPDNGILKRINTYVWIQALPPPSQCRSATSSRNRSSRWYFS